jgi:hypothetical protein
VGLSFPAFGFGMSEQKRLGWTRARNPRTALGSETKKRRSQVFSHLKRPRIGQNELAGGPKASASHSDFLAGNFSYGAIPLPTFLPLFLFGLRELALQLQWQCPD